VFYDTFKKAPEFPGLLSVGSAIILHITNERNKMENTIEVPTTYNANVLVQYKDIVNGEVTFPIIKVTDLEWKLERVKILTQRKKRFFVTCAQF